MKLIIFSLLCVKSLSMSTTFQLQNHNETNKFKNEMTSLMRLLLHIKNNYFEDRPIFIKYDSNFEKHLPLDFKQISRVFSTSFLQEQVYPSLKKKFPHIKHVNCNYIIFLEKLNSVKNFIAPNSKSKIVLITIDASWIVRDFLKSHLSRFYENLLILTHSLSRRANESTYLLYTHKLYSDGSGASEPILLSAWNSNFLTQPKQNLFPDKLGGGFKGHRLLISTAHKPPFTMRKTIQGIYDTEWDGIDIRVLRLLGGNLGFAAEFRDPVSSMPSGTESIINDISEDEAPVAVGGVYQTSDLLANFDTPFSYMSDCASFISLSSTALPKYRAVLRPFQDTVWILLCVVYIIAIIPFTLNSDYTFLSLIKHPSRLNHMFWFVFCTFTNAFDMKNPLLTRGLGKHPTSILIGIYWIFTIIITTCYTGSLIAFITIPDYPPAIESAQQLLKKHYRIGTLDHDGWEKWFTSENMEDQIAKNLLKSVELVPSVSEGVKNASRSFFWPYAFLGSRTALEYSVQTELSPNWKSKRSLMHISDECFVRFGVTIVLKSQSFYTEPFNKVILRAKQSGLIRKIQRDIEWDVQRSSTGKFLQVIKGYTSSLPIEERELVLDDTQGMFLVLSSGFLIAIISLLSEYFSHLIMTDCGKKLKSEIIEDFDEKNNDWSPSSTDNMIMSIRSITTRKSI